METAYLYSNAHTHCAFCDGKCTAEEMVRAAIEKGFHTLGFSSHSHLNGEAWTLQDPAAYKAEIQRLKRVYAGRIDVVPGLEWDLDSDPADREGFAYIIGSVHRIRGAKSGQKYEMDHAVEEVLRCRDREFDGDGEAMTALYFKEVKRMIAQKPDILGHMDLPRRRNSHNCVFDENAPGYLNNALEVLEQAARAGILVEINTGGNFRGSRTDFYPAKQLLPEFARMGGKVILTSDSHQPEALNWKFEQAAQNAKEAGFRSLWYLTAKGFCEEEIR